MPKVPNDPSPHPSPQWGEGELVTRNLQLASSFIQHLVSRVISYHRSHILQLID